MELNSKSLWGIVQEFAQEHIASQHKVGAVVGDTSADRLNDIVRIECDRVGCDPLDSALIADRAAGQASREGLLK